MSQTPLRLYLIEPGIPIPARATKGGQAGPGNASYRFKDMKPGDSFAFSLLERDKLARAASVFGKRHKMIFLVRAISPTNGRVWRTS